MRADTHRLRGNVGKHRMATLTGWIDYDRPHLAALTPPQRIDYFEKRTRLVAINPLRRILENEVHPKDASGTPVPNSSALLIFGVAVCCSIESLGKFVSGDTSYGNNHIRFKAFLHKYMSTDFQTQHIGPETFGVILWNYFRNGLAHGFAVCHGGYEGGPGASYFVVKASTLEINPTALLDDLSQGFNTYLGDLRAASPTDQLFEYFDAVFTAVFINGN